MTMYDSITLRNIISLTFLVTLATASTDMNDFFPGIKGNLTKITWAHAVNNQTYLTATLADENIMMIEADVVLSADNTPIMAHPPATTSDLTLTKFIDDVNKFNTDETNLNKKGVKLDFKTIEAFEASSTITDSIKDAKYPIWINADILYGPINATTVPVDAAKFLTGAIKNFPNSTLSIGWTTLYEGNSTGAYGASNIQEMTDAITTNNVTQDVTFPVRAGLAAESIDVLSDLIKTFDNSTLTIWSSEGDYVNVDHLRNLIAKLTISKVYVDVPSDLLEKLRLDDLPNRAANTIFSIVGIVMSVMLTLLQL